MTVSRDIEIVEIETNGDETVTVTFDMSIELLSLFAGIGIKKVLVDAANENLGAEDESTDEEGTDE